MSEIKTRTGDIRYCVAYVTMSSNASVSIDIIRDRQLNPEFTDGFDGQPEQRRLDGLKSTQKGLGEV